MQIISLPRTFEGTFNLSNTQHGEYLHAVGGGHPVHSLRELAVRSGFMDVPSAGIHVLGAAMARFTQQFARNPMQLVKVDAKFLRPVYPNDDLTLALELVESDCVPQTPFVAGRYQGACTNAKQQRVLMIDFVIRVAPHVDIPTSEGLTMKEG